MKVELNDLYKITKKDLKQVLKVIERAFINWSLAVAIEPNEEIRRTKAHYFYAISIKNSLKFGKAYAPTSKIEGIIMWLHSDYYEMSLSQMIKNGAFKALYKLGYERIKKAAICIDFAEKVNANVMKEPHYHLTWLGVEPELQKMGYGTNLMHGMLQEISREGMKCFVDTQERENVDYYKRFGFKLILEDKFPILNVNHYGLLWEPDPLKEVH
ncbi:MAG: GNAT family N-acetyltransferase [Candidatus Thorarchaeota archaeon]